jgi:hypothetical protein
MCEPETLPAASNVLSGRLEPAGFFPGRQLPFAGLWNLWLGDVFGWKSPFSRVLAKESVASQLAHRVLWKKASEGASPARRKLLIRKQQRDRVPEKGTDATIAGSGNKIASGMGNYGGHTNVNAGQNCRSVAR